MSDIENKSRFLDLIEGSLAMFALVGLISITGLVVFGLNPRAIANINSEPEVAGLSTEEQIQFKPAFQSLGWDVKYDKSGDDFKINLNFKETDRGQFVSEIVEITNQTINDRVVNLSTRLTGPVGYELFINLEDDSDNFILYDGTVRNNKITIKSGETRKFRLKYTAANRLNYEFGVELVFNR